MNKERIEKLQSEWHPTKNEEIKLIDFSYGNSKKVWWKCGNGHEWVASIASRFIGGRKKVGNNCPYCSNKIVCETNCLLTTHPEIAAQWHPTKNGNLNPTNVVIGSAKKVWWKCNNGKWPDGSLANDHEWEAKIVDRKRFGCPCCCGRIAVPSNSLAANYPELIIKWHPTKNVLTPYDVTPGSHKKVWWKCGLVDDHEWEAVVKNIVFSKKSGCPCCVNRKAVNSNCLLTTHPEIAAQWHPTKNGNLNPTNVTYGSGVKIWWICPKAHVWKSNVNSRSAMNTMCPVCNESKGEKIITNYLKSRNIKFDRQFRFKNTEVKNFSFDFNIMHPNFSGLIEFHGRQHYEPVYFGCKKGIDPIVIKQKEYLNFKKIQIRDQKKELFCEKNQISLIIIPYWEQDNIKNILYNLLGV